MPTMLRPNKEYREIAEKILHLKERLYDKKKKGVSKDKKKEAEKPQDNDDQ